ncbi:hypothetical protein ACZ11_03200 [Lysinibacillus xylanilyticus]|uniref:Uncharacterized protein n=1 Tax=Lysinibacillus xylanilyticus TaxID=582475 RepID=A0A0K9F9K0_9BACI|nr:hypothetical protein ACZ11_03200 [Lysinibacillus xylanilyticus]
MCAFQWASGWQVVFLSESVAATTMVVKKAAQHMPLVNLKLNLPFIYNTTTFKKSPWLFNFSTLSER